MMPSDKIELIPIEPPDEFERGFAIRMEYMHGDADADTEEYHYCVDEDEFIKIMGLLESIVNLDRRKQEQAMLDWEYRQDFDFWLTGDCTADHSFPALLEYFEGYFIDDDGVKWHAVVKG